MGRFRFRWIWSLVAVAMVAGAATGFAQLSDNFSSPAAPVPVVSGPALATYLTMKGQNTGTFKGGYMLNKQTGLIKVIGLDMGYDTTATPSCSDIEFRKLTDQTTPQLFHSARSGEQITSAAFNEYRTDPKGGTQSLALQIRMEGGVIKSIHHVDSVTTGPYDDVVLRPEGNVTVTWVPSHISDQYCNAP